MVFDSADAQFDKLADTNFVKIQNDLDANAMALESVENRSAHEDELFLRQGFYPDVSSIKNKSRYHFIPI